MKILSNTARRLALTAAIMIPMLMVVGSASAQSPVSDAHWLAWLGCWQPTAPQSAGSAMGADLATVCVIPGSGSSAVEVVTVKDGAIASSDAIGTSGERHALNEEGCVGWESDAWSQDGRRLYRHSQQDCTGGTQRQATGLLTILPDGDWLNAQGVTVGDNTRIRVLRYSPTSLSSALPAEAVNAIEGNARAIDAARTNAAQAPATEDIVDASNSLDGEVVAAWLIEQGQGFAIDSNKLIELADAGVKPQVIDVMVALSYPRVFAINGAAQQGEFRPDENQADSNVGNRDFGGMWDPWGYGPGYGWGYYPGFGFNRFGYGYNGYRGYGYGGYGGYYGSPIIIVRGSGDDNGSQPPPAAPTRGKAVKGKGYTRPQPAENSGATSRPSPSRGSTTSSGAARPSSDSGNSGSSSSSGRTAKPRGS